MSDENTQTTTQTPAPTPPTDTQQDKSAGTGTPAETPLMTEAQLTERLERARKALLSKLGFEDEKAAKTALDEAKKLKEAQMSEAEKTAAALKDAQDKREAAEARVKELEHKEAVNALNAVIASFAEDAHNPQHVIRELASNEHYAAWIEKPNDTQIKAALEALRKGKDTAYLFKAANGGRGSPPSPKGTPSDPTKRTGDTKFFGI